jgi:hypothetical protein
VLAARRSFHRRFTCLSSAFHLSSRCWRQDTIDAAQGDVMMISKPSAPIYGSALAAVAIVAAALAGCGSSGGDSTTADAASLAPVNGAYSPSIDPANFSTTVDNRYFPLTPGSVTRSMGVAENGKTPQADRSVVTHQTKTILGVDTVVVLDTISSQGQPVERTHDWYAQDTQGNVWYFGEDSFDYKNGHFVKNSGSWQSAVNGAQPGIIMEANPKPGDAYRQEYYPGHALDQAKVLSTDGAVHVPYKSFPHTLGTIEHTSLEPDVKEKKWYAPGIGEIKSADVSGSHEQFQLVSVKP